MLVLINLPGDVMMLSTATQFSRTYRKAMLIAVLSLAGASLISPSPRAAEEAIDEQAAHAIAVSTYIYLYPLITMDTTRRQMINVAPGKAFGRGPMNVFANVPSYPPADMKVVVRPNFDTLYSVVWLDLTTEPMVVSVPDTQGRYYLLPMLDMWTDVFASPGWRTTGTKAGTFVIVPPGWRQEGELPKEAQRIDAPTPYVWVIGRTKTDGPADYTAVNKLQEGFRVTPLSNWGKAPVAITGKVDPSVDMKTPPKEQVDNMPIDKYFAYGAELMKLHPPHITDEPMLAEMRRIGLIPGESFEADKLDPAVKKAFTGVREEAQQLMAWKMPTLARVQNGWSMNTDTMGVYGNYYLKRAIVSQLGLGANLPEDAIYPLNIADSVGRPLDGARKYILHFEASELPPVKAFWSITLYDSQGFQVANGLNRFAVSSWMPFTYNPDGSLDLYFQHESPGAGKEANWLPAPVAAFNLTMRLYGPKEAALTGKWAPPPVTQVEDLPALTAQ